MCGSQYWFTTVPRNCFKMSIHCLVKYFCVSINYSCVFLFPFFSISVKILYYWKKLYGHSGSFINKTDIGRTGGGAESSVNLANPVFGEHVRDSWQKPIFTKTPESTFKPCGSLMLKYSYNFDFHGNV